SVRNPSPEDCSERPPSGVRFRRRPDRPSFHGRTRRARPLLSVSPSLKSYSIEKSPYSFSLISQVPHGSPPCSTPLSTLHATELLGGWLTSFQARTAQPCGRPSFGKSGYHSWALDCPRVIVSRAKMAKRMPCMNAVVIGGKCISFGLP